MIVLTAVLAVVLAIIILASIWGKTSVDMQELVSKLAFSAIVLYLAIVAVWVMITHK